MKNQCCGSGSDLAVLDPDPVPNPDPRAFKLTKLTKETGFLAFQQGLYLILKFVGMFFDLSPTSMVF
jgi:hypothetical protein